MKCAARRRARGRAGDVERRNGMRRKAIEEGADMNMGSMFAGVCDEEEEEKMQRRGFVYVCSCVFVAATSSHHRYCGAVSINDHA